MAIPSVCAFVRLSPACIKTAKCFFEILLPPDSPIILVFRHWGSLLNSDDFTPNGGTEYKGVRKLGDFWPISGCWLLRPYLGNGARYGHSCSYRSRKGNRTQAIEWWHFRWPWVTPTPCFKVTLQFEGEYLANMTSCGFLRDSWAGTCHTWRMVE